MFPQLYINYKLKSVEHIQWRFMAYKFLNTIIDDMFAFIIKMPFLRKLNCFKDGNYHKLTKRHRFYNLFVLKMDIQSRQKKRCKITF
jgi:hypothetical protein